jgi:hypothetical protein
MKKRFYYELRTKRYACICVLTSEIERVALALGPDAHVASTYIYTDRCVDPATLESEETAVIRHDRLAEKRAYLRSIIEYYGHDKATLHRLGFLPA